jgi:hypothetical protein
MRRLTHLIVLAAFIFSCGGQWCVFQCVAWANMIREYSQMVPFTQAVGMTFSGQYPCAICKAIAEKNSSEQQKILTLEKYDKKFCLPTEVAAAPPIVCSFQYRDWRGFLQPRSESPPTPPPRLVLG